MKRDIKKTVWQYVSFMYWGTLGPKNAEAALYSTGVLTYDYLFIYECTLSRTFIA